MQGGPQGVYRCKRLPAAGKGDLAHGRGAARCIVLGGEGASPGHTEHPYTASITASYPSPQMTSPHPTPLLLPSHSTSPITFPLAPPSFPHSSKSFSHSSLAPPLWTTPWPSLGQCLWPFLFEPAALPQLRQSYLSQQVQHSLRLSQPGLGRPAAPSLPHAARPSLPHEARAGPEGHRAK